MSAMFADTSYWIALVLAAEQYHPRALVAGAERRRHRNHSLGLGRTGAALARASLRHLFLAILDQIEADPAVHVVAVDDGLFRAGVEFFRRRPDKDWSLTDCISFVVMQREGVTEALTADHHFEQAGFVALLK